MLKGEGNILSSSQQEELLESITKIPIEDEEEEIEELPEEAGSLPVAIDVRFTRESHSDA
jgi:hypothetical protein